MSKRKHIIGLDYEKTAAQRDRDYYPTPARAAIPLFRYLKEYTTNCDQPLKRVAFCERVAYCDQPLKRVAFCEPCAGGGHLIRALTPVANCVAAYDLSPSHNLVTKTPIQQLDFRDMTAEHLNGAKLIITNPPWTEKIRNEMIEHFVSLSPHYAPDGLPVWFLLSSNIVNNQRFAPYMRKHLDTVVPVGRVSWMNNGKGGTEDASWYRFVREKEHEYVKMYARHLI